MDEATAKMAALQCASTVANELSDLYARLDVLDDTELKLVTNGLKLLAATLELEVNDRLNRNWN